MGHFRARKRRVGIDPVELPKAQAGQNEGKPGAPAMIKDPQAGGSQDHRDEDLHPWKIPDPYPPLVGIGRAQHGSRDQQDGDQTQQPKSCELPLAFRRANHWYFLLPAQLATSRAPNELFRSRLRRRYSFPVNSLPSGKLHLDRMCVFIVPDSAQLLFSAFFWLRVFSDQKV